MRTRWAARVAQFWRYADGETITPDHSNTMNTRYSTDIVAWIIAVLASFLIRGVTSETAILLAPTLLACGIAGAIWTGLRALSRHLARGCTVRSVSAALSIGSAIGTGVVTLLVIAVLDLSAARGVVALALVFAGVGWGLASDCLPPKRNAQTA
jgi:hypothetical protein